MSTAAIDGEEGWVGWIAEQTGVYREAKRELTSETYSRADSVLGSGSTMSSGKKNRISREAATTDLLP